MRQLPASAFPVSRWGSPGAYREVTHRSQPRTRDKSSCIVANHTNGRDTAEKYTRSLCPKIHATSRLASSSCRRKFELSNERDGEHFLHGPIPEISVCSLARGSLNKLSSVTML